jgi:hypothetical protein
VFQNSTFSTKKPLFLSWRKGAHGKLCSKKENAEPGHGREREFSFSLRNLSEPLAVLLVANEKSLHVCWMSQNAVAAVLPRVFSL